MQRHDGIPCIFDVGGIGPTPSKMATYLAKPAHASIDAAACFARLVPYWWGHSRHWGHDHHSWALVGPSPSSLCRVGR
jgi:hypothetical protein